MLNVIGPTVSFSFKSLVAIDHGKPVMGTMQATLGRAKDPVSFGGLTLFPFPGKDEAGMLWSTSKDTEVYANSVSPKEGLTVPGEIYHELTHVFLGDFGKTAAAGAHGNPTADAATKAAEEEATKNAKQK